MIKYLNSLWLVLLMLSFLTACGSSTKMENDTGDVIDKLTQPVTYAIPKGDIIQLRFWTFHLAKELEFMKSLAEQYQAIHPEVEIKVEYVPSDEYFHGTRLISAFASGQGPDIFFVSSGNINKFIDAQIIQPLTSKFSPAIKKDFSSNSLDSVTVDREIYAVPFEVELLGLYYNEAMFRKHGLTAPKTWNEMIMAARELRTDTVSGLTVETLDSVYQTFTWLPFLWQTGADLLVDNGLKSGLHQAGTVKMYDYFKQMRDEKLLNLYPSRPTNDIGILANGETAMQVSGSWNVSTIEQQYSKVPINVVPLPIPEGGSQANIGGGWKIAASRNNKNADEAAKFVMWAFAEGTANPLKWVSNVKFAYSPRSSVMQEGKDFYTKGLRSVFTEQIYGKERPEPRLPSEITQIFNDSIQDILFHSGSSADVLQKENEQITTYLSTRRK
ncbi:sugar ABC transporter substrate-binding protein [Paenibacillus psychroresistens]|uniref:Sugar ABC transporter substrate-binding protein n=1 Tax=Paenibacillus psychroresistens TaxID=1778678 RepID=A0A6B8RR48_9BACL|nr:sugar ABC transporter substrate-binding protein [Paenibacillus psychroresistens]QGQ98182.1 sugar ABC transporter substrate-binding protein [Paenibacillus psychroresistens]